MSEFVAMDSALEVDDTSIDVVDISKIEETVIFDSFFYGILKKKLKEIVISNPSIKVFDFSNCINVKDYRGLKAQLKKDFPTIECKLHVETYHNTYTDYLQVELGDILPQGTLDIHYGFNEMLQKLSVYVQPGQKFILNYENKSVDVDIKVIVLLAQLSLMMKSNMFIDKIDRMSLLLMNKAEALLCRRLCSNSTEVISTMYTQMKEIYQPGRLVVVADGQARDLESSYLAFVKNIGPTFLTVQRIRHDELLTRVYQSDRSPRLETIYYNDIYNADTIFAPIEVCSERDELIAVLKTDGFKGMIEKHNIDLEYHVPVTDLDPLNLYDVFNRLEGYLTESDKYYITHAVKR